MKDCGLGLLEREDEGWWDIVLYLPFFKYFPYQCHETIAASLSDVEPTLEPVLLPTGLFVHIDELRRSTMRRFFYYYYINTLY